MSEGTAAFDKDTCKTSPAGKAAGTESEGKSGGCYRNKGGGSLDVSPGVQHSAMGG